MKQLNLRDCKADNGLKIVYTKIRPLVTTNMDWSDVSKLVNAGMRVGRWLVDEKKNKVVKEDPCG